MRRTIVAWHADGDGEWVAELSCLHAQHVRHQPPFRERSWVTTEDGRSSRVGGDIECSLCDRAEPPDGLHVVRTAGPFDEVTLPAGLRRTHLVGAGVWGVLTVLAGEVAITIDTEPPIKRQVREGESQPIPPEVPHRLDLVGPFRLRVDFFQREG